MQHCTVVTLTRHPHKCIVYSDGRDPRSPSKRDIGCIIRTVCQSNWSIWARMKSPAQVGVWLWRHTCSVLCLYCSWYWPPEYSPPKALVSYVSVFVVPGSVPKVATCMQCAHGDSAAECVCKLPLQEWW